MRRFLLLFLLLPFVASAQDVSQKFLKVHFLYGSKPRSLFRETEKKYFGGLHGGHVTIELDGQIFGFQFKDGFHYVSHRRHPLSCYSENPCTEWVKDTVSFKYVSIVIPITTDDYQKLKIVQHNYLDHTPYDYAFLGMRCAAATEDVLSQVRIGKRRSRIGTICFNFFPQPLRRRMLRLAAERNYTVVKHPGRTSRIWENE
jgi:hypothetical protein